MTQAPRADLTIVYRDPNDLRPYEKNARTHPPAQIAKLRASIRSHGFTNPVLLRDDEMTIGAGHGRVEAAIEEGLDRIPTIILPGLTDAQWRTYIIADNRIALDGGWNLDILKAEILDLRTIGADLNLTGFDIAEVSNLFATSKVKAKPDEVPAPPRVATSRPGDVWLLGEHRLICGDATDAATVKRLMDGETGELTLTDPPYGLGFGYNAHDDSSNETNAALVANAFKLAPAAKVWSPGPFNLWRDIRRFGDAKVIYWHKKFTTALSGLGGATTVEPLLALPPFAHRKLPNDYLLFPYDNEELEGKSLKEHHPCPKPVGLFAHLAESFCSPGGIVYEPFSGSGTTLIACSQVGRRCRAVEIDPVYVDVAVMRWEGTTDETARLQETGRSFAEMKEERGGEAV